MLYTIRKTRREIWIAISVTYRVCLKMIRQHMIEIIQATRLPLFYIFFRGNAYTRQMLCSIFTIKMF